MSPENKRKLGNPPEETPQSDKRDQLCATFVENIIKPVTSDRLLLKAFGCVDRAFFAPDEEKDSFAIYRDSIIPIADGSSMSQPSLVAKMLDHLSLTGNEKVLEIGTGSGYNAALLSLCAKSVHTVEYDKRLVKMASEKFQEGGFANVTTHVRDGALGVAEEAPFERIIITACVADIPQVLFDQLAEGGIIVAPVKIGNEEILIRGIKQGRTLFVEHLEEVSFHLIKSNAHGGFSEEAQTKERAFDIVVTKLLAPPPPSNRYTSLEEFAKKHKISVEEARRIFETFGQTDEDINRIFSANA